MQQPLILVDAGNLLFKKGLPLDDNTDTSTSILIANGLVRAYKAMGYDAVAVSTDDLSAGPDFFQQANFDSFPWIAANVFDKNANLLFAPHVIKRLETMTVGIIGLTGNDGQAIAGSIIGDWRESLQKEISLLQKSCDMLLVLSNLSESENREIQQNFQQIDIIVTAARKGANMQPQLSAASLLVESGGRGKYLGRLAITWHGQSDWSAASRKSLAAEQKRQPFKSYKASFLPVKPSSAGGSVDGIVADIKDGINTYNRHRLDNSRAADPVVRLTPQESARSGFAECARCHRKQTEFWKSTRHASAYATLARHDQAFNLQCLPCHVTAGTVDASSPEAELVMLLSLGPERRTIGCAVCHGPGKQHMLAPEEVVPVRLPAETICTKCHTSDRDNNFIYQKKLADIACPAE